MGTSKEYVTVQGLVLRNIDTKLAQHPCGRSRSCACRRFRPRQGRSKSEFHVEYFVSEWFQHAVGCARDSREVRIQQEGGRFLFLHGDD